MAHDQRQPTNDKAYKDAWNDVRLFGTGFVMITAEGAKRIAPEDIFTKPESQPTAQQKAADLDEVGG